MNDLANQGRGGIERKTLNDLIQYAERHRENVEWFNSLYARGEIPIHIIPTSIRAQLVDLYHQGPTYRESEPGAYRPGILAVHGGRPAIIGFPKDVPRWRLNLDITSLLLAHHLGILPKLEHAFAPLRLPPSIFGALDSMQGAVSAAQVSQIEAARHVLLSIENGQLIVKDEVKYDPKGADLSSIGGAGWARLYELSRDSSGFLIDFIPKIGITGSVVALPDDADARVVNCRAVIEALRAHGALSADDYLLGLDELGTEGNDPPVGPSIPVGSSIFCQATIARLLAGANLLRPACRTFRLQILREDADELKATVLNYERAQVLAGWLNDLASNIRQGIDQGTYQLIPVGASQDENDLWGRSNDAKCLLELLSFATESSDVIWADDRYLNAFQRRDNIPIVSMIDILKALVTAKELTVSEFYRILIRLRAAKFYFIPLEAGEILHHLAQGPVSPTALTETPELGTLRRYWSGSLIRGKDLQRPGDFAGNLSGEIAYVQLSVNAIRDAIVGLWKTGLTQTEDERETRAEWLLQLLYVDHLGVRALTGLPAGDTDDHVLIGVSLGSLIAAGFEMRLAGNCTSQSLEEFLRWVYYRVLQRAFERDSRVLQSAGDFLRTTLRAFWQTVSSADQKGPAARLILFLIEMLPSELQEVIQTDEILVRELSLRPTPVVRVGDLQFEKIAYLKAARAAVNGKQGKARAWRSREEMIFELAPAGMIIKRPSGQELHVTDPLVALLSDRPEERFAALSSRPDWFDCDIDERKGVIDSIVQIEDDLSRVEETERWRDSSAAVFYAKLARELEKQGSFKPDDLRPPNAAALFRYYRLSCGLSLNTFLGQIESGSEQIAREFGVYQAFVRYAGFPSPLPAALVKRISDLPEMEKRQLVKSILRTAGSPVSDIHLLHLLAHLAESRNSKYWRLAKRVTKALISSEAAPQFSAFQALLHWTENAFGAWPEAKKWSVADRIAMVWGHTHRVFSTLTYLGIVPTWMSERFRRPDFGLSDELFGNSAEYCQDIAHPRRIARENLVLSGLSYAAAGKDSDWWNDLIRREALTFIRPQVDGEPSLALGLLRDPSLARNALGAFLDRDRSSILSVMLGEETSLPFATASLKSLAAHALDAIRNPETRLEGWKTIFYVLGDFTPAPDHQQILESAINEIDLSPVANDQDACETLLYAGSMQAVAMQSASARDHLSHQLIEMVGRLAARSPAGRSLPEAELRFYGSLFQIVAHLGWSCDVADQPVEFTRILMRVMDAFPAAMWVYRPLLNRIWPCEVTQSKLLWPLLVKSRSVG